MCFVGHTHELGLISYNGTDLCRAGLVEGTIELSEGRKYIVNSGSVGQPRDGDNRGQVRALGRPDAHPSRAMPAVRNRPDGQEDTGAGLSRHQRPETLLEGGVKTIGKYVVCGLLGRGGMGAVFKVRLPIVEKVLALKLLAPHPHLLALAGEEEVRRRFTAEAAAMADLRHPNIIDVLDFDFHDGRPFYTMEYYYQNLGTLLGESDRADLRAAY